MKICFITQYAGLYGANKSLLDIISLLISSDNISPRSLYVLLPDNGSCAAALRKLKVQVLIHQFEADWYDPKNLKAQLARKRRINHRLNEKRIILRRIKEINPDIIYSNSSVFLIGAYMAGKLGIRHIWHIREDMDNHYRRKYDSPKVAMKYYSIADTIVCPSNYIKRLVGGFGEFNTVVIPNIVDGGKKKEFNTDSVTFGVVGLIHKSKNQLFILKSLKTFIRNRSNSSLVFIGDGDKGIVRKMTSIWKKERSLNERVAMLGRIEDQIEIYKNIDVLINLSEFEAFGRVNLEAFSRGIPVIGLNSGATPEIVKNNYNGLVIEKKKSELIDAVTKMMNPTKRKELGQNAFDYFRKNNIKHEFVMRVNQIILGE